MSNDETMSHDDERDEEAEHAWAILRASTRPVHALIQHASADPDPHARLERIVRAMPPDEAAALGPEIESEKERAAAAMAAQDG